jgi:hypothetical protein
MKYFKIYFPILIFLSVGIFIANEINGFLKITYKQKTAPESEAVFKPIINTQDTLKTLGLKLIDMGGVGILPDSAKWGNNYEHNVHRYEDMILPTAPFIDSIAFQRVENEFKVYVNRIKEFNYNGIIIHGFLEFINFDSVGNGKEIYPDDSEYRLRHQAFKKYFSKLINVAHQNGLKVYMSTDMASYTTPLKKYIVKNLGTTDVENKKYWDIYKSGAQELFGSMPGIDGIVLRVGEAGSVYNRQGWDYYSELVVTTDKAVQMMLNSFINVAETHNKLIIFRTWSVGVGQVGDMHTNTETYHRIFDSINSNHLILSTKYCSGDFYSWLPFNSTLLQGNQRRITEFQCRREYEGMNAFPNYLAPLHQQALQHFCSSNNHFDGFWLWSQEGGPLRAGPLSLYPLQGFNVITDANAFATAKLGQNPYADLKQITNEWGQIYFGNDSLLTNNITEMLLMSHEVTRKGLYISEFAKYDVRALGLEPPPMMWIFEWDMVGASSSALGSIYYVCKSNLKKAVAEGYEAIDGVKKMKTLLTEVEANVSKNKNDYTKLLASLNYQENLFTVLAEYRSYFLNYYHWLDTGDEESLITWQKALSNYRELEKKHQELYSTNLDFPAYNFREANVGAIVSSRNTTAQWFSRLLILLISIAMILPFLIKKETQRKKYGINGLSLLWRNILLLPNTQQQQEIGTNDKRMVATLIIIVIAGGLFIFTSFSAPLFFSFILFLTVLYKVVLSLLYKKENTLNSLLIGSSMLIVIILLAISSVRGPMMFWFLFWTSAGFRLLFFSIFIASVLWIYYVLYRTSRQTYKMSRLKSFANILLIQGLQFIAGASIVLCAGFEKALTAFNDELLVLPGGLSRILGITTHLNIPVALPQWIMYIGFALSGIGMLFLFIEKRKRKLS